MRPGCFAEDIISNRTIQAMPCSAPVYAVAAAVSSNETHPGVRDWLSATRI
eukprot:COSAG06_NODE_12497_length_1373_cov_5.309262_2_plen_50_part_01